MWSIYGKFERSKQEEWGGSEMRKLRKLRKQEKAQTKKEEQSE